MDRMQARNVAFFLKELGSNTPGYSLRGSQTEQVITGWSSRAEGLESEGVFLVEAATGKRMWIALLDWQSRDDFYLLLVDDAKIKIFAQIHKWTDLDGEPGLTWRYQPTVRDGRNDERVNYFVEAFLSRDVNISVPASMEDIPGFLDELFLLAETREKADELMPDRPSKRSSFPEGKTKQKLHFGRERNASLVRMAKQNGMDTEGRVRCACCNLDFFEMYGTAGKGFIEAHHTKPVSTLHEDGGVTLLEDIALVCSNCHRMLHRKRPWLEMHELAKLLAET